MIENLLRESASLQDTEARSQMIHEIAKHASKEIIGELILILQDTQSPLIPVALEVLEIIGYPKNASAIPAILWYIDNGTSPLFEKALQILVAMGPAALPNIVHLAQENEAMDALVINALSKVGYYVFVQLQEEAEFITERVLQALATHPEESLEMLLYVLSNPIKVWWEEAVKIVSAIGYPQNAPAIPLLVAHACLGNDLAEKEAIQSLVALGPKIVVPYLLEALWDEGQTSKYLSIKPEDIVWLLLDSALGPEYLIPCGSMVSDILLRIPPTQPAFRRKFLQVLERIGPQCAIYALPALLNILRQERGSDLGVQIRKLIATFDQEALEPYMQILQDSSEQGISNGV